MVSRFTDAVIWKSRALLLLLFIFCMTELILLLADTLSSKVLTLSKPFCLFSLWCHVTKFLLILKRALGIDSFNSSKTVKLHRSTESICHRTETTEDYVLPLGAACAGYVQSVWLFFSKLIVSEDQDAEIRKACMQNIFLMNEKSLTRSFINGCLKCICKVKLPRNLGGEDWFACAGDSRH